MISGLLVLIGAFALAAQTLVLREYLVLHDGNELSLGLFYASWFAWIAASATTYWLVALPRRSPARSREARLERRAAPAPETLLSALLLAYPLALLVQILLIRATRTLAEVPPTEPMPFGSLALWTLLTNAPVSLVTGVIFPVACAVLRERQPARPASGSVSRAYVFESVGSFAGGLLVTALLGHLAPPLLIALGITVALALGSAAHAGCRRRRWEVVAHGALGLSALVCLAGPWGRQLSDASVHRRFAAWMPDAELLASGDTPYQHASVARADDQLILLANGRIASVLPDDEMQSMRAALLMSQPSEVRRVLLLGAGAQGLLPHLLDYPVEELRYVEPDERAFQLAEPHLPSRVRAALADDRVRVAFTDGRRLIHDLARAGEARFDLLIVVLPDPDTASLNRYFTVDFYRAAARVLAHDGVLATRITSGENVLGTEVASYGASIYESLRRALAEVLVTPGEESWFLAAKRPGQVSLNPAELARRYSSFALPNRRFPAEGFQSLLDPERVRFVADTYRALAARHRDQLLNRDTRPVTYFLNLLVLGRHTGSSAVDVLQACRDMGVWLFLLPLGILALLRLHAVARGEARRGRHGEDAALLLAAVGLAGIALQLVLLLSFQSRFGVLFREVGLVNALFMVGLAFGATCAAAGFGPQPGATGRHRNERAARRALTAAALCAVLALATPALVERLAVADSGGARRIYYGLFLVAGSLSGAAFPLAGFLAEGGERRAGAMGAILQAADHLGAALGALLVGTLLVPVVGIRATCGLIAAALGGACLAVLAHRPALTQRLHAWHRGWQRLIRRRPPRSGRWETSFPWSRLAYLLVAITLVVTVPAALLARSVHEPTVRIGPHRLAAAVQADSFEERSSPFVHYLAFEEGRSAPHNATVASLAVTDEIQGYVGPLNLLVSVDADGTIRRVELIASDETPAYVAGLGDWLKRFEGRPATRPFHLRQDPAAGQAQQLDGLTGATVTSRAVVGTVNASAAALGREVLGLSFAHQAAPRDTPPWSADAGVLILLMAASVVVLLRGSSRLRSVFLAAVVVLLGINYNVQLSMSHLVDVSRGLLPGPGNLLLLVLLAGVGLLAIAFGPAYCALLCPFGAAQELVFGADRPALPSRGARRGDAARSVDRATSGAALWMRRGAAIGLAGLLVHSAAPALLPGVASRLGQDLFVGGALTVAYLIFCRLLRHGPRRVSPQLHARARFLKYVLLAAIVVASAFGFAEEATAIDPLAVAFSGSYATWTFLLLASLLLLNLRYFRFWCRFFCPVGALTHLGNAVGLLQHLQRRKRYRRCDLGVRSPGDIDCIQCNRCLAPAQGRRATCWARPRSMRGTDVGLAKAEEEAVPR